mmetsp:Transcript_14882/g.49862  ORF Transcript_14882/g.49862 Transcript_14882/m.49862 type:complete len:302 (-) Transcript_14882:190-1095(-)
MDACRAPVVSNPSGDGGGVRGLRACALLADSEVVVGCGAAEGEAHGGRRCLMRSGRGGLVARAVVEPKLLKMELGGLRGLLRHDCARRFSARKRIKRVDLQHFPRHLHQRRVAAQPVVGRREELFEAAHEEARLFHVLVVRRDVRRAVGDARDDAQAQRLQPRRRAPRHLHKLRGALAGLVAARHRLAHAAGGAERGVEAPAAPARGGVLCAGEAGAQGPRLAAVFGGREVQSASKGDDGRVKLGVRRRVAEGGQRRCQLAGAARRVLGGEALPDGVGGAPLRQRRLEHGASRIARRLVEM